jgi:hypothetical protein
MIDTPLALDLATPEDLEARREAEQRGRPFLLLRDDDGAQQIITLEAAAGSVTVGRRLEADVPLNWDPEVSRMHAELEAVGQGLEELRLDELVARLERGRAVA